jgi:hypothetical protein
MTETATLGAANAADASAAATADILEERLIDSEYKIWKKVNTRVCDGPAMRRRLEMSS